MADEANDAMKTPVTIVTGFLGAGKTTLVNTSFEDSTDFRSPSSRMNSVRCPSTTPS